MSRIGKKPITIPKGVEVKINGHQVTVKGPKGTLNRTIHNSMSLKQEQGELLVVPLADTKLNKKFHGLTRSLVANMIEGVAQGYSKSLTLIGVGYRAAMKGKDLSLTLGFSHPVVYIPPTGVTVAFDKQTTVLVSGADKEAVGQAAANIRGFRPPEPYHGKGVRYSDEHISTKAGKTGGK
jgi:large subunit ribosomal protein L6